jgi:hypothetical protein
LKFLTVLAPDYYAVSRCTDSASWHPPASSGESSASYYDAFAHVTGHGGYLSNSRMRRLVEHKVDQTRVLVLQAELIPHISYLDTYPFQPTRADAALSETNLLILLHSIVNSTSGKAIAMRRHTDANDKLHLTQLPYPAHAIYTKDHNSTLLAAGVVRGFSAPMRYCELELHAVSGSACLELSRRGLGRADCVVPGIGMAGRNVQFFATYLLSGTFPVMVALTPELRLTGTMQEQMEIATWCVRVADFAFQTAQSIPTAQPTSRASVVLNMAQYFPKPLSDDCLAVPVANAAAVRPDYSTACVRLQRIMEVYQRLHEAALSSANESDRDLVLFPEGVVTVPGPHADGSDDIKNLLIRSCGEAGFRVRDYDCRPVMLFPRLFPSDGWTTAKPPPELRAVYVQHLRRAVQLLNLAGVAHLDLRPSNIMWRRVDPSIPSVEMRLVDFADAQLFDTIIPNRYVSLCDRRYPFSEQQREAACSCERAAKATAGTTTDRTRFLLLRAQPTQHIVACAHHNAFFLDAVAGWVQSSARDFSAYMDSYTRSGQDTPPSRLRGLAGEMHSPCLATPTYTAEPSRAGKLSSAADYTSKEDRACALSARPLYGKTEVLAVSHQSAAKDCVRTSPITPLPRSNPAQLQSTQQAITSAVGVGGDCGSSVAVSPPPPPQFQRHSHRQALSLLAGSAVGTSQKRTSRAP